MTTRSASSWTLPPIVHVLREATREAHDRLDASSPVFAPNLELSAYHLLLGRYLAAHLAAEHALERWAAALASRGVALDERRKVPLLRRDRARTASLLATSDDEPRALSLSLPTLASAWGALYVAEGSTLGAQHIMRTLACSDLARHDGLNPDVGFTYFSSYGASTGEKWRQFLSALGEADGADPGSRDTIIDGARSTFTLFERALSNDNPSPPAA